MEFFTLENWNIFLFGKAGKCLASSRVEILGNPDIQKNKMKYFVWKNWWKKIEKINEIYFIRKLIYFFCMEKRGNVWFTAEEQFMEIFCMEKLMRKNWWNGWLPAKYKFLEIFCMKKLEKFQEKLYYSSNSKCRHLFRKNITLEKWNILHGKLGNVWLPLSRNSWKSRQAVPCTKLWTLSPNLRLFSAIRSC